MRTDRQSRYRDGAEPINAHGPYFWCSRRRAGAPGKTGSAVDRVFHGRTSAARDRGDGGGGSSWLRG